ncbi:MAG: hypothetical protein WC955_07020 [Elusimicrobiota bacterium]
MSIFLLLIVCCICINNLVMKLMMDKGYAPETLTFTFFCFAGIFAAAVSCFWADRFVLSPKIVMLGILAGVAGAVATQNFMRALATGLYSYINVIIPGSFIIPVIYSIVVWNETIKIEGWVGIGLVLLSLLLLALANNGSKHQGKDKVRFGIWLMAVGLCFIFNGLAQVVHSEAAKYIQRQFLGFITTFYLTGIIGTVVTNYGKKLFIREVIPGSVIMAMISVTSFMLTMTVLTKLSPAVVFPFTVGAPVIVGLVLSKYLFHEKVNTIGYAGIVAGIAGIVFLYFATI